jgi:hypoxanthine phosphoribosyltransferase
MRVDESETILHSAQDIAAALPPMARAIATSAPRPDIAVPVLAGAFVFAADLLRALAREGLDLETDFVWLRSYGRSERPGDVTVIRAPSEIVRGRRVLLIDGVLESGTTLACARNLLQEAGAAAILSAVAVVKPHPAPAFRADHALFQAGPEFLYGYGMDRDGMARGLPDIRIRRKT